VGERNDVIFGRKEPGLSHVIMMARDGAGSSLARCPDQPSLRGIGWRDGAWRDDMLYSILRTDPPA
jgi:hypothetical protein